MLCRSFKLTVDNKDFLNMDQINTLGQLRVNKLINELKTNENVLKIKVFGAFLEEEWSTKSSLDFYVVLKDKEDLRITSIAGTNYHYLTNFSVDEDYEIDQIEKNGVLVYKQGTQTKLINDDNYFKIYSYGFNILDASKKMLKAAHSVIGYEDDVALSLLTKSLLYAVRYFLFRKEIEYDSRDNVIEMFNRAEKQYKPVPITAYINENDYMLLSVPNNPRRRIGFYDVYEVYEEIRKSIENIENEVGHSIFSRKD